MDPKPSALLFTAPERDLIRREFCRHFGQFPSLAEGVFLRRWASGPQKGRPKVPPTVQGMVERGLIAVVEEKRGSARAIFTRSGVAALRRLLQDRRAMDPKRFMHLRIELGLDEPNEGNVAGPVAASTSPAARRRAR